jgi:hypothetical protein
LIEAPYAPARRAWTARREMTVVASISGPERGFGGGMTGGGGDAFLLLKKDAIVLAGSRSAGTGR